MTNKAQNFHSHRDSHSLPYLQNQSRVKRLEEGASNLGIEAIKQSAKKKRPKPVGLNLNLVTTNNLVNS